MTNRVHIVALRHGKFVNLGTITSAVHRDDAVKLWYLGEDGSEMFIGEDAVTLARRLNDLAQLATHETAPLWYEGPEEPPV